MPLKTILFNEEAKIEVDLKRHYIELTWFTHPDSTVFRNIIIRGHEYAHQHQLTKWFCNLEQAEYLDLADQHWLVQEIFTAFNPHLQHDYAYLIRPLVSEILTTYHIRELVEGDEKIKAKIEIAIFTDINEAQQWLFTPTAQADLCK